jgi:hypothetical protein
MSDPDDPPAASPPARSIEASRRLSQLLARPLGTPAPPGEVREPYVPRPARVAPPPAPEPVPTPEPPPAAEAPDDTASVAAPPPVALHQPDLPWFDRPAPPKPTVEPPPASEAPAGGGGDEAAAPLSAAPDAHAEWRDEPAPSDDDLFERREPPPLHVPAPPEDEFGFGQLRTSQHRLDPEPSPQTPDHVPEWAWPSALDRSDPEPAPARAVDLDSLPRATAPEAARPAPSEPAAPAPPEAPVAAKPLDPDATRTLGNIRRLMLASNLFVVVAIGAVLAVVGYRIYRTEPAPPPAPPPAAAPAPAKIPIDMTLTLPRGARIVEAAAAGERLVITLEVDGATEIRTFDIKTLQPTGRMSFTTVP